MWLSWYLLQESLDDRRGKDARVTPRQAKDQRNYWDKSFNGLSIESWATLLYQVWHRKRCPADTRFAPEIDCVAGFSPSVP